MQHVDGKHGVFSWFDGVDENMHSFVVSALLELNATKHRTLTFILSTHGGDAHVGFALYDLIKGNEKPVRIIVNGRCNSAGTLILQAGSERLAFPHSHFLIHFGEQGGSSQSEFEFDRRQHFKWIELMTLGCKGKTTAHDMELMHRGETYLTANEALLHGLIDRICTSIRRKENQ